jgi:hypothetical protein
MTAATILRDSAAAGVTLSLSAAGMIKATGEKAAVGLWLATIKENKVDIITLLSEAARGKPCRAASRWLLHFSDRNPLTVDFSPPATHAKVLVSYPSALAAEPIEAGRRQPDTLLTGRQEAAVVGWLAQIGESDEAIVGDVLAQCRHDEDARQYFLGRAGESATSVMDDRRRCDQCGHLRSGVCVVAKPGGVVSAIRGYRPATGVPQRCLAYMPAARSNLGADPGRWIH